MHADFIKQIDSYVHDQCLKHSSRTWSVYLLGHAIRRVQGIRRVVPQ